MAKLFEECTQWGLEISTEKNGYMPCNSLVCVTGLSYNAFQYLRDIFSSFKRDIENKIANGKKIIGFLNCVL